MGGGWWDEVLRALGVHDIGHFRTGPFLGYKRSGGDGTLTRHGLEEYVSDCVIVLDHRITETRRTAVPPTAPTSIPS